MRLLFTIAAVLSLALAGCGGGSVAAPAAAQRHAGHVYVAGGSVVRVIDAATGRVERTLPAGTPSPDWSRLYRVAAGAVDVVDPLTGAVRATHPVPAWVRAVRTSADGTWLALTGDEAGGRFAVQDAAWSARAADVALPGRFTYDGISPDGRRLYLLQDLDGDRYQVRMYDVRAGALAPDVISDKSEIGEPMSGTALASFTSRGAAMQLTLYQRSEKGRAFVHALPIRDEFRFAFCVDLPGPQDGWGFAAASSGERFYAVNAAAGVVAELHVIGGQPPDLRQRHVAGLGSGPPAVAVGPDGATVYVGTSTGVHAVDAATLKVTGAGLAGQTITALAAGRGAVYAVSGASRLLQMDARSLAVTAEVAAGSSMGAILRVD